MPRVGASSHGESRLRMLRIVKRGDRHDPRDLSVSCRMEGDFGGEVQIEVLPGEAVKNLVHATARAHGSGDIERFGLALCDALLARLARATRVRVEIAEQLWSRLEVGGKAQGQAFALGSPEHRTAAVTSNRAQIAVVSGLRDLTVMRTSGFAPARPTDDDANGRADGLQRLLVAALSARWTYTSADVTFGPYRHGVRAAIVDTIAAGAKASVYHTLHSIADVVLSSYAEIAEITLTMNERPYRPADLFSAGLENPDDLFVAIEEPVGVVEVTVERE